MNTVYSSLMSEKLDNSIQELLSDKKRKNILLKAYPEIKNQLEHSPKKGDRRNGIAFEGMVFEKIAIHERIAENETRKQTIARKIIEDVYKNSSLLLGSQKPKNPDFVSVVFDKAGNLIIDEIVEVKISTGARKESRHANQPQETLDAMEKIVEIANLLISGVDLSSIPSEEPLSSKRLKKRISYLSGLKNRIKNAGITEKILFAENLKYLYMLPKDYSDRKFTDIDLNSKKLGHIKGETIFSKFSRKNVEDIIDHYAETP